MPNKIAVRPGRSPGCTSPAFERRRRSPQQRADIHARRRPHPVQALRQLSSSRRNRADVAADLRAGAALCESIANAVTNRTMPPWHADAPAGTFHNERIAHRRGAADTRRVGRWRRAERRPEGFAAAHRRSADGWSLANRTSCWKCWKTIGCRPLAPSSTEWFYIPTNFSEPKWVKSIEVRPGDRAAVHHVLVYYRAKPDTKRAPVARANREHQANPPPDEQGVAERPRRGI